MIAKQNKFQSCKPTEVYSLVLSMRYGTWMAPKLDELAENITNLIKHLVVYTSCLETKNIRVNKVCQILFAVANRNLIN